MGPLRGPHYHSWRIIAARWAGRRLPPTKHGRQRLARLLWSRTMVAECRTYLSSDTQLQQPSMQNVDEIGSEVSSILLLFVLLLKWLRDPFMRRQQDGKVMCGASSVFMKSGQEDSANAYEMMGARYDLAFESYGWQHFPSLRDVDDISPCEDQYVPLPSKPVVPDDPREERMQQAQWKLLSMELNGYQSECFRRRLIKYGSLVSAVSMYPCPSYGMENGDDRDARPRSRSRSPQPEPPESEVMAAVAEARFIDEQNVRNRTTRQTARVDRYNETLGLGVEVEWQAQWRFRNRISPPRHREDASEIQRRWANSGRPVLQIRIMQQSGSRYVWITFQPMQEIDNSIRPADIELHLRHAYFHNQQIRFIMVDEHGYAFRHNEPMPLARLTAVTAFPAEPLGSNGSDDNMAQQQQAFAAIRRNHPHLLNSKVLRTILRAQPQVARRIAMSDGADKNRQRLLIVSAAQRAGLAELISDEDMKGVTRKQGQLPHKSHAQTSQKTGQVVPPPSSSSSSSAPKVQPPLVGTGDNDRDHSPPEASRWRRRQKADQGWQVVTAKRFPAPKNALVDEWNAPPVDMLSLGKPGVMLANDSATVHAQARAMKGNPCKTAVLFFQKLEAEPGVKWQVTRVAYHVNCTYMKNGKETTQRCSRVGYLHNLHQSETVDLVQKPKAAASGLTITTSVVRIQVHRRFCPDDSWDALQQGRIRTLSEQIKRDIAASDVVIPSDALQDVFQMQSAGRIVSALMRVKQSVIPNLLALSGASWIFFQPLGSDAEAFPVSWAQGPLPESLVIPRRRAKESGAVGLVVAERRLGFRAALSSFDSMKEKLGQESTTTWRLAGAPLTASSAEAEAWMTELGPPGSLLHHTRRVRRGVQDWLIRTSEKAVPTADTLSLVVDGKDYLLTLSKLLPRSSPANAIKQWTTKRSSTSPMENSKPGTPVTRSSVSEPSPEAHSRGNRAQNPSGAVPLPLNPSSAVPVPGNPTSVVSVPSIQMNTPDMISQKLDRMASMLERMQTIMQNAGLWGDDDQPMQDVQRAKRPAETQLSPEAIGSS